LGVDRKGEGSFFSKKRGLPLGRGGTIDLCQKGGFRPDRVESEKEIVGVHVQKKGAAASRLEKKGGVRRDVTKKSFIARWKEKKRPPRPRRKAVKKGAEGKGTEEKENDCSQP